MYKTRTSDIYKLFTEKNSYSVVSSMCVIYVKMSFSNAMKQFFEKINIPIVNYRFMLEVCHFFVVALPEPESTVFFFLKNHGGATQTV